MDTSTLVMGVAILEENKVIGELITNSLKKHSVRLMPAVDQLMKELELSIEDIDLLAVTKGPGSYTGIRIGVATAKTIAWAQQIPLYGISTLAVLAENGFHFDGCVVPLLDARRERVYTGVYQREDGDLKPILTPRVIKISALLDFLEQQDQSILFLGDDCERYFEQIQTKLADQAKFGTLTENIPRPSQLGYLAWKQWKRKVAPETDHFAPDYLQLTQAEVNWIKQQKNGGSNERRCIHPKNDGC